ncbi:MAG: phage baseplate assembly protein V [Gammaproteobacteria bacterium]|nr:MAG: phage baseplate assembly protein V [Gammaproteobacteria bacterium]
MMKALERLARSVRLMIGRGVLRLVDDAKAMQMVQLGVLAKETREMERFQDYGFTCVPKEGAEAIVAALGGRRDHLVALRIDDRRFRLKNLNSGEVALYDDLGNVIHFKRDRILVNGVALVEVTAPAVTINAATEHNGNITLNGDLTVNGQISASGQINSDTGVSIGALELGTHVHGGVTTGSGNTGGPQ